MQPAGVAAPLKVDIREKAFQSAEGVTIVALRGLCFEGNWLRHINPLHATLLILFEEMEKH